MKGTLLTWCILNAGLLVAQQPVRKEPDWQRLTDELLGFQDENLNYEELYENLAMLLAHPLNINQATAEQLRFLNLLSEEQLQNLLRYREENGPLLSLYELQAIDGFDRTTWERVSPFLTTGRTSDIPGGTHNGYILLRYTRTLQTKAGFTQSTSGDQRFRGSADALYLRLRSAHPGKYSVGLTAEKDAGEQVYWNPANRQYGMDFVSPHVQIMNRGRLHNLIIGHYQAQVGQGLVLGNNFGFGKGGETVTTVRRSNLGFVPYTSLKETGYLNGAALTVQLRGNLYFSPYWSYTRRDASLVGDSAEQSFITSFPNTGLHRNANELNRRKQVTEQQYGAVLNYRHRTIDAGVVMNTLNFDRPLPLSERPYNQFAFRGSSLTLAGAFANYTFRNFTFFSEAAQSIGFGYGWVAGLMGSLTTKLDMVWLLRHYRPDFHSFYANAFTENTRPQNEQGVYFGWKQRLNQALTLSGYVDFFRFPWLRYRAYAPDAGHEWLLRLTYEPSRSIRLTAQLREESKGRNALAPETPVHQLANAMRHNLWLIADYTVAPNLRMRTRAQFSDYTLNSAKTRGMLVLQDVIYGTDRFNLTGRYALFDTDDYDNRQFVFENDVWLAYTFPAWYGKGIRSYLLAEYKLLKALTLWLRIAHTTYADRTETGSGADRINGPQRTDIRLQLKLSF